LEQKLELVRKAESSLRYAVSNAVVGTYTWGDTLAHVLATEEALRGVRAVVRAKATKERRENCPHEMDRRQVYNNGSGRCRDCGLNFKAAVSEVARRG
jgi:hypothetical protein